MCNFISWIEIAGKGGELSTRFLTTALIDKALEMGIDPVDLAGHEAIRRVYGLEQDEGRERECVDFSTPTNFPVLIVEALLSGRVKGSGFVPQGILSKSLYEEYWDKLKVLDDEYEAKREPLDEEYWNKPEVLYEEHVIELKPLDKEYLAKLKILYDEYWALVIDPICRAPAWSSGVGEQIV